MCSALETDAQPAGARQAKTHVDLPTSLGTYKVPTPAQTHTLRTCGTTRSSPRRNPDPSTVISLPCSTQRRRRATVGSSSPPSAIAANLRQIYTQRAVLAGASDLPQLCFPPLSGWGNRSSRFCWIHSNTHPLFLSRRWGEGGFYSTPSLGRAWLCLRPSHGLGHRGRISKVKGGGDGSVLLRTVT